MLQIIIFLMLLFDGIKEKDTSSIKEQNAYSIIQLLYLSHAFDEKQNIPIQNKDSNIAKQIIIESKNNVIEKYKNFLVPEFLIEIENTIKKKKINEALITNFFLDSLRSLYSKNTDQYQPWIKENLKEIKKIIRTLNYCSEQSIPKIKETDDVIILVMGASRKTMINRLSFLKKNINKISSNKKDIFLLSGERELDVDLDSLKNETREETISYLKYIAQKFNVHFDATNELIKTDNKIKLNTTNKKITETMVLIDLYEKIFADKNYIVINSPLRPNNERPNTESTVIDFAKYIKNNKEYNKKNTTILVLSNQPYIIRQLAVVQNTLKRYSFLDLSNNSYGIGSEFQCESEKDTQIAINEIVGFIYYFTKLQPL